MASTSFRSLSAALLLFICASAIMSKPATAFGCDQVLVHIATCVPFVQGVGVIPPAECCVGIAKLNIENHLLHDRQEACKCFQAIFKGSLGYNPLRGAALPLKCGVNLGYPAGLAFDCNKLDGILPGLPGLPELPGLPGVLPGVP